MSIYGQFTELFEKTYQNGLRDGATQERERLKILIEQSIATLRSGDYGESRNLRISIAAREHVLTLLEPEP